MPIHPLWSDLKRGGFGLGKRMAISVKGGGQTSSLSASSLSFPFIHKFRFADRRSGVHQTGRRQTRLRRRRGQRAGRVVIKVTAAISLLQLTNCCRSLEPREALIKHIRNAWKF